MNSGIKTKTTKNIDSFVQKYSSNKFLITSRPYTSIDLLPLFTNFNVSDLEDDEIAEFVQKQIPASESELANKIIESISKMDNLSYKSFLSNPLLLSMFILTFQTYSNVPQKRSEFYDQVFDTLFSIHDSVSKLAYVREKQSGLAKDEFEEVLQLFSFLSFFEEKFIFPNNYLTDKLNIIKSKKKSLVFNNEKFIDDLQVAIGILNKEGLDYTFPHRSLQEYFAAVYISKVSAENKKLLYSKLRNDIENNIGVLLSKDHFFGLLAELDYNNLSINLSIPLVKKLFSELKSVGDVTDKLAYEYYGKLWLPFYILLRARHNHKEVHQEVIGDNVKYVFFSLHKNSFSITEKQLTENREYVDFDTIKTRINNFKACGDRIIRVLEKSISDSEKSDSEIIDLI